MIFNLCLCLVDLFVHSCVADWWFQKNLGHGRVQPKFQHSNATSHKWAFGVISELLDNVVDEVSC